MKNETCAVRKKWICVWPVFLLILLGTMTGVASASVKYTVTNTGAAGGEPSVSGNIIAFVSPEVSMSQDLNGDGDTEDIVIRYLTIEMAPTIESIADQVDEFLADGSIENQGHAEALQGFLEQAQAMIDKGNTDAAKKILEAFINLVEAQSGKKISEEAAQILINSANTVIEGL